MIWGRTHNNALVSFASLTVTPCFARRATAWSLCAIESTAIDIEKYAASLYSRINEAKILKRAVIEGGNWQPEANMCHHNVTIWCEHNPGFAPARGWLYFDLPGLNYVKFVAHSAVIEPSGDIRDITPSNATQDYPFLLANLSEEEYASLVETIQGGELHCPK